MRMNEQRGSERGGGTIAGEGTLYYVLAGAVLAELGLGRHVRTLVGPAQQRGGERHGRRHRDSLLSVGASSVVIVAR